MAVSCRDELQIKDSSYTKGTNSLVMSELVPNGWFIVCAHMNRCHKTRNGWYSGLMAPVSSIVGLLVRMC